MLAIGPDWRFLSQSGGRRILLVFFRSPNRPATK
jgi:hypothetical protein